MTINNLLKEKNIRIEDLILDPNNPRFSKHHEDITPLELYEDSQVQEETFSRMIDPKNKFEIDVLLAAIKADGFIHVDKIFVRKIKSKFLVIEGNRRVTAIKKLLKNYKNKTRGYEISQEILMEITEIPCVVIDIDKPEATEEVQKILGLRHHGSILPWKPLPAAFNLYSKYMEEFCKAKNLDRTNEENFMYDPVITKKVAAIFSVEWSKVKQSIRLYRVYLQLLNRSNQNRDVESAESFSKIEETLGKPALRKYFEYDETSSTFSDEGVEKILDIYYGLKDKPAVITGASIGSSNIRDFSFVIDNGTEQDIQRIVEGREDTSKVKAEIETKQNRTDLQKTLDLVRTKLNQIELGDIGSDGFAPNEIECIKRIDEKLNQLKRAAGLDLPPTKW